MTRLTVCLLTFMATILAAPGHDSVQAQVKPKRDASTIAAVHAILEAQRDAWNQGNIDGYMDGYARTPDITFVSGDSFTRGWQTVRDRYQKNYDTREKMGTLTFSDLETTVLSTDAAVTIGRWHLQLANGEPHGRFTLIFRRTRQGWRIVHDHTSSAP
jgi:ketosteroid isomerase-like protein